MFLALPGASVMRQAYTREGGGSDQFSGSSGNRTPRLCRKRASGSWMISPAAGAAGTSSVLGHSRQQSASSLTTKTSRRHPRHHQWMTNWCSGVKPTLLRRHGVRPHWQDSEIGRNFISPHRCYRMAGHLWLVLKRSGSYHGSDRERLVQKTKGALILEG